MLNRLVAEARSLLEAPTPEFLDVWHKSITKSMAGLDLNDPEDRATFRGTVDKSMKNLKASGIRDMIQVLGVKPKSSARGSLTRAVADAYISGKRLLP